MTSQPSGFTFQLKRTLPAPASRAFEALTDPAQLPRRWGPVAPGSRRCEQLTVEKGPFSTEPRRALHKRGWPDGLEKLEALLS